jgi:hypothetical protein
MRDFIQDLFFINMFYPSECGDQCKMETNVKQNEELSKRAIPGVTKYLAALRHAQGAYLIAQ